MLSDRSGPRGRLSKLIIFSDARMRKNIYILHIKYFNAADYRQKKQEASQKLPAFTLYLYLLYFFLLCSRSRPESIGRTAVYRIMMIMSATVMITAPSQAAVFISVFALRISSYSTSRSASPM